MTKATHFCKNCQEKIAKMPSGNWAHILSFKDSEVILYNCRLISPHYGPMAEPGEEIEEDV